MLSSGRMIVLSFSFGFIIWRDDNIDVIIWQDDNFRVLIWLDDDILLFVCSDILVG
jgi:hypothetical protein